MHNDAPSEADLAYARAVAADALARGSKDNSIPWENPNTGAGGNITPLATAYNDGAATCRDFLASYVRGPAQSWLQGAACRTAQGKWEVKTLRPMKQG
jgi:surface antigen